MAVKSVVAPNKIGMAEACRIYRDHFISGWKCLTTGEFLDSYWKTFYLVWWTLAIVLDGVTTHHGVTNGLGEEANPIPAMAMEAFGVAGAIFLLSLISVGFAIFGLGKSPRAYHRIVQLAPYTILAGKTMVGFWNIIQIS